MIKSMSLVEDPTGCKEKYFGENRLMQTASKFVLAFFPVVASSQIFPH
jgi:hypothetical protein